METSPSHGATSSASSEQLKKLLALAERPAILKISKALGSQAELNLVGGAVRDAILGKKNIDIDLASALKPDQVISLLEKAKIHTVPTGISHGTVLAVLQDESIEITTFRNPGGLREKTATFSDSIITDLQGRDFTINAMAYSIAEKTLIDPWNGLADLKTQTIRAVDIPLDRFKEDPLRLMRMIRFGSAENRSIENSTLEAAKSSAAEILSVSVERIRDELLKILCRPAAGNALKVMREIGLLDHILPEVIPSYDFEQNEYHRFDVFEHTLAVIDEAPTEPLLRLTALFHDLGKPKTLSVDKAGRRHFYKHEIDSTHLAKNAMRRLRFSNQEIKEVTMLVRYHMRPLKCGPAAVRRLIRDLGSLLDPWLRFKEADSLGAKVTEQDLKLEMDHFKGMLHAEHNRAGSFLKLKVSGKDLMDLGLEEGPNLGKVLNALRESVLNDPELNDRERLLSLARSLISAPQA